MMIRRAMESTIPEWDALDEAWRRAVRDEFKLLGQSWGERKHI